MCWFIEKVRRPVHGRRMTLLSATNLAPGRVVPK